MEFDNYHLTVNQKLRLQKQILLIAEKKYKANKNPENLQLLEEAKKELKELGEKPGK